jgi:hypothetical protein
MNGWSRWEERRENDLKGRPVSVADAACWLMASGAREHHDD